MNNVQLACVGLAFIVSIEGCRFDPPKDCSIHASDHANFIYIRFPNTCQVSHSKSQVFKFTISILSFRIVCCNEKIEIIEIVKLVASPQKIHMYFLLRSDNFYDFKFFIAKNSTERPNRNRKVENPSFFNGMLVGPGNQLRRQPRKGARAFLYVVCACVCVCEP